MMRKSMLTGGVVVLSIALTPAYAVGLGDLAKVILGGGSVLKQGAAKCGSSLALSPQESMQISSSRSIVQKALSAAQFGALDQVADTEAKAAAQSPTFCDETKVKKKGILGKIGSAAKKMAGKSLGL